MPPVARELFGAMGEGNSGICLLIIEVPDAMEVAVSQLFELGTLHRK